MSAPRDLDRLLQSFLAEGPLELPNPSYDEVRDRMEHKRQRAFIGPWRTPDVDRYLKIGLVAAAVVLIAIVGFQFLGNSNTGGPTATETPQPTAIPEPSSSAAAGLPVGSSHVLWDGAQGMKIVVTIPAPGWFRGMTEFLGVSGPGGGILKKNRDAGAPDGAGLTVDARTDDFMSGFNDLYVYGDP